MTYKTLLQACDDSFQNLQNMPVKQGWPIFLAHYSSSSLFLITGRIAPKRQTAGIKFTHKPKVRFFAPQERLVAPIQVKLCRTDWHLGPLACAKFHLNRHRGWECGPRISKISTFWKRVVP